MSLDSKCPQKRQEALTKHVEEYLKKGGKISQREVVAETDVKLSDRQKKGLKKL